VILGENAGEIGGVCVKSAKPARVARWERVGMDGNGREWTGMGGNGRGWVGLMGIGGMGCVFGCGKV
jgi:hypothetical protein